MGASLSFQMSGIGDQDVQTAEALAGEFHKLSRVGRFPEVSLERFDARAVLAGFLLHLRGSLAILMVAEDNIRARLRE